MMFFVLIVRKRFNIGQDELPTSTPGYKITLQQKYITISVKLRNMPNAFEL